MRHATAHRLLFDVDGVLLDGESVYTASWTAWAQVHDLDPAEVVAAMHGRRPAETVAEVAPHLDVVRECARLAEGLSRLAPIPGMAGAQQLLGALPPEGWAIITSSRERHVRRCFDSAGLPVPRVAVFSDDVEQGKPAPDGYLQAARKLGVEPALCTVVEDSPAGVQSGKAAGCLVIGIGSTHRADELRGAAEVFPSLVSAIPLLLRIAGLDVSRPRGPSPRWPWEILENYRSDRQWQQCDGVER